MADIAKWALLVAGALVIIGMILSLPFVHFLEYDQVAIMVDRLVVLVGDGFTFARGLINNFIHPFARDVLSGLLYWMFGKFAIVNSIKILVWTYHFIFK